MREQKKKSCHDLLGWHKIYTHTTRLWFIFLWNIYFHYECGKRRERCRAADEEVDEHRKKSQSEMKIDLYNHLHYLRTIKQGSAGEILWWDGKRMGAIGEKVKTLLKLQFLTEIYGCNGDSWVVKKSSGGFGLILILNACK